MKWSFFKRRAPCPASQPSARAVKSEPEALATQHTLPHSMPPSGDVKAAIHTSAAPHDRCSAAQPHGPPSSMTMTPSLRMASKWIPCSPDHPNVPPVDSLEGYCNLMVHIEGYGDAGPWPMKRSLRAGFPASSPASVGAIHFLMCRSSVFRIYSIRE